MIYERKNAIEKGLRFYNDGSKCLNGHLSDRYTSDGRCVMCQKNRNKKNRNSIDWSDYQKSYQKIYRKTDAGKKSIIRSNEKNKNARKSREYFFRHKDKVKKTNICESCLISDNLEAHHDDYDFPMKVRFLCKKCHGEWHTNNEPKNKKNGRFTNA